MNAALVQGIDETIAEALKLSFYSAITGIKNAFFRFLELALVEMILHGTLSSRLTKRFDRLLQSDALMGSSVEKIGAQYLHLQVISVKSMYSKTSIMWQACTTS